MWNQTFFLGLLSVWALVTLAYAGLLVYRSVVSFKEDDQLFLDPVEHEFAEEQERIRARLNRIQPYARGLGFASGGLLVAMLAMLMIEGAFRLNLIR